MPANSPCIDILLATCDGVHYIDEQLDSLHNQTFQDWQLVVSDDCSQDKTVELVERSFNANPSKLRVVSHGTARVGVKNNFAYLLKNSNAPYFMFCDQDDFWLRNKVALSFERMAELEKKYGSATPILVHTDLTVADDTLKTINASFWGYQQLDPVKGCSLRRLLVQNQITGCTVICNQALRELVNAIPASAIMHDWWLGLVVASFGVVDSLAEPTVLYRQHGGNCVGAQKPSIIKMLGRGVSVKYLRDRFEMTLMQAKAFYDEYQGVLPPEKAAVVGRYLSLMEKNAIGRRLEILRNGFFKTGLKRNLALMAIV